MDLIRGSNGVSLLRRYAVYLIDFAQNYVRIGIKEPNFLLEADHSFSLSVSLFRVTVSSGKIYECSPSM
jgi:hypothetical protein